MVEQVDSLKSSGLIATTQHDAKMNREQEEGADSKQDRVTLNEQLKATLTYGPGNKVESSYDLIRDLVMKTLSEQGIQLQINTGDTTIDLNEITQEEAQELVSEDGYFGVEKTSQRIVDFAINAFGHDPDKLQEMKDAIDKGFEAAEDVFGGELPEISQQTYDAIMDKLDAFAGQFADNEE